MVLSGGGGCTYCQGLRVLWGETNNHEPVKGLYLRWEMSFRTSSDIFAERSRGGRRAG